MSIPGQKYVNKVALKVLVDKESITHNDMVECISTELKLTTRQRNEKASRKGNTRIVAKTANALSTFRKSGFVNFLGKGKPYIVNKYTNKLWDKVKDFSDGLTLKMVEGYSKEIVPDSELPQETTTSDLKAHEELPDPLNGVDETINIDKKLASDLLIKIKGRKSEFLIQLAQQILMEVYELDSEVDYDLVPEYKNIYKMEYKDQMGFTNVIYLQAKIQSEGNIEKSVIQEFAGALQSKGARKGIFITNSKFDSDARNYVNNIHDNDIILIDGNKLVRYMIDYNVGVSEEETYVIKKIDSDYFEDEL